MISRRSSAPRRSGVDRDHALGRMRFRNTNLGHRERLRPVEDAEARAARTFFCASYRGGVSVGDRIQSARTAADAVTLSWRLGMMKRPSSASRRSRPRGVNFLRTRGRIVRLARFPSATRVSPTTSATLRACEENHLEDHGFGRQCVCSHWRDCSLPPSLCSLRMQPRSSRIFGQAALPSSSAAVSLQSWNEVEGSPYTVEGWVLVNYATSVNCSPPRACYASSQWVYSYAYCAAGGIREMKRVSLDLNGNAVAEAGERVGVHPDPRSVDRASNAVLCARAVVRPSTRGGGTAMGIPIRMTKWRWPVGVRSPAAACAA